MAKEKPEAEPETNPVPTPEPPAAEIITCPGCGFAWEKGKEADVVQKEARRVKSINREALIDLALFGPLTDSQTLFMQVKKTADRLGVGFTGVKIFQQKPLGVQSWPGILDVTGWLNQLTPKSNDVKFLQRLGRTLGARLGEIDVYAE